MNYRLLLRKIFFVFVSFPLLAQNEPLPAAMVDKILFLQELVQHDEMQKFACEVGYIDVIKRHLSEQSEDSQNGHVKEAEQWLKEIFVHLQFDSNSNSFPRLCYEEREQDIQVNTCISTFWNGKLFMTTVELESRGLSYGDQDIFESAWTFVFAFDTKNNSLKLFDYGVAG